MYRKTHKACAKVVLFGEYGALLGYKALVASIHRFAQCHFSSAPKLSFIGIANNNNIENSPIFNAVIKASHDLKINIAHGKYVIDTSDFFTSDNKKLGIGSSSAALVALCKSIIYHGKNHHSALIFALKANYYLSNGLGSGIDIIAAFAKGINKINTKNILDYKQISHKKAINFWSNIYIIYTNKEQTTNSFTKLFWQQKNIAKIKNILKNNHILYNKIFKNKCYKNDNLLIDIINRIDTNMYDMQNLCSFKFITDEHIKISGLAKKCFGAAKISGAGGGDISLAYIPKNNHNNFIKEINNHNYTIIKACINK